ncbi:MAG: class I adenylate-forming enzyme family protein, partial [Pontixanthobacter sp.]
MNRFETEALAPWQWVPPAGWPAKSLARIEADLCGPGQTFEMETLDIRGIPTRTWKNAPSSLRVLADHARGHGERLITIYEDERVTYEAWYRAVASLAAELRSSGIEKGDRVALAMRNLPEWPVAFFAVTAIGAICVPLNAWWTGHELAFGLADSGARLLICDAERWERIAPHRVDCPDLSAVIVTRSETSDQTVRKLETIIGSPHDWAHLPDANIPEVSIAPEDSATIFYTSGTTGKPKGALG